MSSIQFISRSVTKSVKFIAYKWLIVILDLIKRVIRLCKERKRRKKELTRRERREAKTNCVPIKSDVYHKPDPTIYSQKYLMDQGIAVTWNNPDIQLKKNGIPVSSNNLEADTEYLVEARIWNNSTEAPVIDMPVHFSFLSFGMGTTSNFIDTTKINLGVKGGANHPSFANIIWKTPSTPGHYCLKAELLWGDDANPSNNIGQENTNVAIANSPAFSTFTLKNDRKKRHKFHFKSDTYTIPKNIPCSSVDKVKKKTKSRVDFFRTIHNVQNYPIPENWQIHIEPETPFLEPNEEKIIEVEIIPPDNFVGEQVININGFDENNKTVGGITLTVVKND